MFWFYIKISNSTLDAECPLSVWLALFPAHYRLWSSWLSSLQLKMRTAQNTERGKRTSRAWVYSQGFWLHEQASKSQVYIFSHQKQTCSLMFCVISQGHVTSTISDLICLWTANELKKNSPLVVSVLCCEPLIKWFDDMCIILKFSEMFIRF